MPPRGRFRRSVELCGPLYGWIKGPTIFLVCILFSIGAVVLLVSLARDDYGFIELFFDKPKSNESPATDVRNWLEAIPLSREFHYGISALGGLYFGWCAWRLVALRNAFRDRPDGGSELSFHDQWIVYSLRRRALGLQTTAGLLMGAVFVLLFGGVYFTLFIAPQIAQSDEQIRSRQILRKPL